MQAQARAMSADERELNRANQSCDNYGDLGLPSGMSSCESCDNYGDLGLPPGMSSCESCDNYGDLGLPPGMSSCESCDNYVGKTYHASSSKGHVCLCARTEPIQSELR